jgi:hypothetical protein
LKAEFFDKSVYETDVLATNEGKSKEPAGVKKHIYQAISLDAFSFNSAQNVKRKL